MKKVIVIGGGLGGISAAASLAAEGFEVEVIEKNAHLGGKLNVLEKEGFSFDLGPSILTMPHIFERLFLRAGKRMEEYVEIEELRPHWRNFFEDGTTIDLYPTGRETAEQSERLSREDGEDLDRFLAYSRKLYESTLPSYFDRGIDTFWGMMKFHGVFRALFEFDALATVDQGVRRYIKNPYLVDILNYFVKYVGSSPYDAPAL
ncbi:MAG: NAD(P)-binding protein, partial [Planctomycetes bacterium]|nr:NAD(P)-binding protein [Planctomycetota bacterium]